MTEVDLHKQLKDLGFIVEGWPEKLDDLPMKVRTLDANSTNPITIIVRYDLVPGASSLNSNNKPEEHYLMYCRR